MRVGMLAGGAGTAGPVCGRGRSAAGAGAQPARLTHPEPAAVVALMELMRSRLAVSLRACRVCWSGL